MPHHRLQGAWIVDPTASGGCTQDTALAGSLALSLLRNKNGVRVKIRSHALNAEDQGQGSANSEYGGEL